MTASTTSTSQASRTEFPEPHFLSSPSELRTTSTLRSDSCADVESADGTSADR